MKILIVGYGRMGHEVEEVARQRGHHIVARVDPVGGDFAAATPELLTGCDGVIEFSTAGSVIDNARAYQAAAVPAVVGTTGWLDRLPEMEAMIGPEATAYLYGANFSLGAHIMLHLTTALAQVLDRLPEYDIAVHEVHHNQKNDSPSGTALSLAGRIVRHCTRKTTIRPDAVAGRIDPGELHVASVRVGSVPGVHTVMADSPADTVEIRHSARNRSGFALGAVRALEWVRSRRGLHTVDEFVADLFTANHSKTEA